jgi:hypothetical protein
MTPLQFLSTLTLSLWLPVAMSAAPLTVTVATPPPAGTGYFKLGTSKNPAGHEISVNSRSLLFDGQPVFPVMGEFHYSRCPAAEWREELLKMKAGGVDIVATYVFWIHHEEIEGQWDWSGQRNLRQFVQTCGELGLKVVVRCGPWCHGEVRNGGFPDWVVAHTDWKLRSTDSNFLAAVKPLYDQIRQQLAGELWKDGGPVIGIQVDNEFGGSPDYLMALKRLAIASGLDVPLYIKTGWPAMRRPVPLGELLPLFGAYPDGFWENGIQPMPGGSWGNYTFKITRTDTGIGNDSLKASVTGDTAGTEKYPHLTCEVGGGMPASYHRRMNYDPRDVEAVVLTQLGGGSSLLGYYMYHGGQNPEGKLSTLQESHATKYPNDLPVKSYDFNAPIGEFGQLNPQYFWLRRLHLFLHDFGAAMAQMPPTLPDQRQVDKNDFTTLRWAVRSDGTSGYVFVNNYQRLQPLPAKPDVQFQLHLPGGDLVFPNAPVTIPDDAFFFWPFNLDLGGARLIYATAQPVCKIREGQVLTVYFVETPGVKAEFTFDPKTLAADEATPAAFSGIKPGRDAAISFKSQAGITVRLVLLSELDSLALRKTPDGSGVVFETAPNITSKALTLSPLQTAGPAREFAPDGGKPIAPTDAEFTNAAVWRVALPAGMDLRANPLLRIHYVGDVARLTLNGRLIEDNFYSGRTFDLGLKRYAPEILTGELELQVLPLRRDAPIYLTDEARAELGSAASVAAVLSAEIVTQP